MKWNKNVFMLYNVSGPVKSLDYDEPSPNILKCIPDNFLFFIPLKGILKRVTVFQG